MGFGVNATSQGTRPAFFAEAARHRNKTTVYGRFEIVDQEYIERTVAALTLGAARDVWQWRGFEGGIGADATIYGVPDALQPAYSARPVSFHLFFRLRPPAGHMGRMWNMRMSQPMR